MCLGTCFDEGYCGSNVLTGEVRLSADGKRLFHRSPGCNEFRSYFKGDCQWKRVKDGFEIVEYHNIELLALQQLVWCHKNGNTLSNGELTTYVKEILDNDHIYSTLVAERVKALLRRGWAIKVKRGEYKITTAGILAFAEAAAMRLNLDAHNPNK